MNLFILLDFSPLLCITASSSHLSSHRNLVCAFSQYFGHQWTTYLVTQYLLTQYLASQYFGHQWTTYICFFLIITPSHTFCAEQKVVCRIFPIVIIIIIITIIITVIFRRFSRKEGRLQCFLMRHQQQRQNSNSSCETSFLQLQLWLNFVALATILGILTIYKRELPY